MNFFPLEPQDPNEEYNDNIPNKKRQSQNTLNELRDILKDQQNKTIENNDIEPLPIRND